MFKKTLIVIFVTLWIALAINPTDFGIWALENVLVVTFFPMVLWLDRRYDFNNLTYLSLTAFVSLHLFGANMTYNNMTYFIWYSDWFGFQRNYYDQFIHFLFGLMVFVPFFEVFYHQGLSRRLSYLIAFLFIASIGAGYEVLEWLSMEVFCPKTKDACFQALTQGDIWDAQKDMAFAIIGALLALVLHSIWGKRSRKPVTE